jgi:hypothetical protein
MTPRACFLAAQRQDETQDETRRDETTQDITRQDKAKQDKTHSQIRTLESDRLDLLVFAQHLPLHCRAFFFFFHVTSITIYTSLEQSDRLSDRFKSPSSAEDVDRGNASPNDGTPTAVRTPTPESGAGLLSKKEKLSATPPPLESSSATRKPPVPASKTKGRLNLKKAAPKKKAEEQSWATASGALLFAMNPNSNSNPNLNPNLNLNLKPIPIPSSIPYPYPNPS